MSCAACRERGQTWAGSPPQCAFGKGHAWSEENWNCATDGLIRDLVYEGHSLPDGVAYQYCDDMKYATVKVDDIEFENGRPLALWLAWYKSRGATDQMWLLSDSDPPRRPTEDELLQIHGHYARYTITPAGRAHLEGK